MTGICPLAGIFVYMDANSVNVSQVPELLPCETKEACVAADSCSLADVYAPAADIFVEETYFQNKGMVHHNCGKGNGGIMCAQCLDGFSKVDGECLEVRPRPAFGPVAALNRCAIQY